MQQWVMIPIAAAFLAGCDMMETGGTQMPANMEPAAGQDTCGAASFADLIGQPRSTAEAAGLPETTRYVGPDDAMTMDFNPQRLTVELNTNNLVEQLTCG